MHTYRSNFWVTPKQLPAFQQLVKDCGFYFVNNPRVEYQEKSLCLVDIAYDGSNDDLISKMRAGVDVLLQEPAVAAEESWIKRTWKKFFG